MYWFVIASPAICHLCYYGYRNWKILILQIIPVCQYLCKKLMNLKPSVYFRWPNNGCYCLTIICCVQQVSKESYLLRPGITSAQVRQNFEDVVNILDVIGKNDDKVDDEVGFCSFLQPSVTVRHYASSLILHRERGDSSKNCIVYMMLIEVHICWLTADWWLW